MSQENIDPGGRAGRESAETDMRSGRTLDERVWLRWPSAWPRTTQSVLRMPPGSRVRRVMLRRAARIAFNAWNRGDFELVPYIDDPEVETHITQSGAPIGFDAVYYGPKGHCRAMETWNEAWRDWRADIEEIIEESRDRFVVMARVFAEGSASGIKLDEWTAVRYTFRQGLILRVEVALGPDRDAALDALVESGGGEALEATRLSG